MRKRSVADISYRILANLVSITALSLLLGACDGHYISDKQISENLHTFIDIASYNIQSLGQPEKSRFKGTRQQQINLAAIDMIRGNADIYALQEIDGKKALSQLLDSLNRSDKENRWTGAVSASGGHHAMAFVYKQNIIKKASFKKLLSHQNSKAFVGRYPYLMTAEVISNNKTHIIKLVNLHLKCCRSPSNSRRRSEAMAMVIQYLYHQHHEDNIIILGDLNVADQGGAYGEIKNWGVYQDKDHNNHPDYFHAAGSVLDKRYNPADTHTDIDHILISDELKPAWDSVPVTKRNRYLNTSISDHSPVVTTLDFSKL